MKVIMETTGTSYKQGELTTAFTQMVAEMKEPTVLEVGTKQAIPGKTSMHREWFPNAKGHYGTDFQEGVDVDITADLHELSKALKRQSKIPKKFDVIISCAVFEHVLNPFVAVSECAKSLNPGGLMYVTVPNCFPIHEFPNDYWRFTIESLSYLMRQAGLIVLDAAYTSPTQIMCEDDPAVKNFASFLMVACIAKKPEKKGNIVKRAARKAINMVKKLNQGK
ncbi:MAG: methyltransferase domain-containing protein [Candidatus Goldbacteria bacterium]|nr:methyltransferase domain-containing protein [Candidatus Goldiibacteriota bacterium]